MVFLFLLMDTAGQIQLSPQGFGKFSFQFNVANYIKLLKTVRAKRCVQAKAKKNLPKKDKTVFSLICGYLLPIEW